MAYDIGPSVGLTGEQEFKSAMSGIANEFKLLGSEMKLAVSQFDKNDKSTEALTAQNQVLGKEIDSQKGKIALLTTQYDKQNSTLATLKDKLDATKLAFGADSAEVAKAQKEYDKQNKAVTDLKTQLNNATTGLNNMERALASNNDAIKENSKGFGEFGEKVKAMGAAIGVGMAAVGAAFLGAVGVGVKMSDDLTRSLNGVQSATGVADEQMAGMKDTMLGIYNDNFGENFADIGTAMTIVSQQTGLAGDALKKVTEDGLALNDTFGFEVNESIRSANQLMQQFGLTGDEAYNLIAQGAQWGLDKNGDLLDSINEYSVQFKGLGFNATEMFNMLQNGAAGGAFSVDKLGDAVKEFGIRAKDGSTSTAGAFKSLGLDVNQTASEFAKGGESGKAAFAKVNTALLEMKDPLLQNQVGTALWGSMWEDLGITGVKALTSTEGEITNTLDALGKINEVKYNSFGESVEGIKRQLLTGIVLPLGQEVLPKMNEFGNYLKTNMPAIIEEIKPVINSLMNTFKLLADNISIIAPILASVVSGFAAFKVITGIATMVSLFSGAMAVATTGAVAATPVMGLLAGAFTLLTGPVGIAVAGIALFAGGAALLTNSLNQEVIPATDLFEESISESTKAAVTAYMDLDKKVGVSLLSFKANNTVITKEIATDMITTFEKMGSDIKTGRDKHYTEDLANLTKFYADQGLLDSKEAKDAIAKMKETHATKEETIDFFEAKVKAIYDKAATDHRTITQDEENQVKAIKDKMQALAIQALTESEVEQAAILTRMRLQAGDITTKQAAEVIASSAKQRDETTRLANEQYEKVVASISRQRDEGVITTDDQAKKMIDAAERQRDGLITKAKDTHEKVVYELQQQNADVAKEINEQDGTVKTGWQELKEWFTANPIIRWIITQSAGGNGFTTADMNASGTDNFKGGWTTMNERGYELYNLPGGSKIYNHQASEAMILKTAQEVAKGVLASSGSGSKGIQQTVIINSPTALSPSETARQVKNASRRLALEW